MKIDGNKTNILILCHPLDIPDVGMYFPIFDLFDFKFKIFKTHECFYKALCKKFNFIQNQFDIVCKNTYEVEFCLLLTNNKISIFPYAPDLNNQSRIPQLALDNARDIKSHPSHAYIEKYYVSYILDLCDYEVANED